MTYKYNFYRDGDFVFNEVTIFQTNRTLFSVTNLGRYTIIIVPICVMPMRLVLSTTY